MSNPIYKNLPGVERKKNGSLYQMTSSQHRLARALIRRECCSYEDGNCMELDDGECHSCIQCHTLYVSCKWFRFAVLPLLKVLEAEIFKDRDTKACVVCGKKALKLWQTKAVDTLRELQIKGLVEIKKQGCGKPNKIYPLFYECSTKPRIV